MSKPTIQLWINGQRTASRSSRFADVTNPATGVAIRQVPLASSVDVENAVAAAKAAFPGWRDTTPLRRSRILNKFRELLETHRAELAQLASEEHGKTLEDASGSVQRGIEVVEFAVGAPHLLKGEHAENVGRGVDCHSMLQPIGVCAGITPFNFPAMVPMWMFPISIACGNTFILKPSEKVPSCSLRMAELFKEAGLPDGVFNVVPGDKEAVDALLSHPDVRSISFVGSTPIAKYIYETAAHNGKRVQALGGAKNHAVVLHDAELDFTADAIMGAAYGSAGERCMAISTVVAVGDVADALVAKLKARAEKLVVGPGDKKGVDMGPVISAQHRDKIVGYIASGVQQGANLVTDGRGIKVAGHEKGFFVGPTLFAQCHHRHDNLQGRDFRPGADRAARCNFRRGDQHDQQQSLRQRHRDLHRFGRGGAALPERDRGRHGWHQCAYSGTDGVLLLRWLEVLAVRRPAHARHGRRIFLHPHQGSDHKMAGIVGQERIHAGDADAWVKFRTGITRRTDMSINVGFIGPGIMGGPMALNLIKGGNKLWVYARRPEAMKTLVAAGATACASAAEVGSACRCDISYRV